MTVETIVFSKNRAAQLDLMLQTYKKYFKDWKEQSLSIIYKSTDPFFQSGYDLVKKYHPEFNWVAEYDFRFQTLKIINESKKDYMSFYVDDDILIDYYSLSDPEVVEFFNNKEIGCVSPRLAPYINFCYTQNQPQPPPKFIDGTLKWEWRNAIHDWGYISSVDGHIFRRNSILQMNNFNFRAPNSFEGAMCSIPFEESKYMVCYQHSKVISSVVNKVQTENGNLFQNTHPIDELNKRLLMGHRLSPDVNHQYKLNMCHGPMKLEWI